MWGKRYKIAYLQSVAGWLTDNPTAEDAGIRKIDCLEGRDEYVNRRTYRLLAARDHRTSAKSADHQERV